MARIALSVAACLLATACVAAGAGKEPVLTPEADMEDKPIKVIKSLSGSARGEIAGDAGMKKMILMAREDLAKRLQVDKDAIDVLEARYVTWRDSSYGCPKPDAQYMQVLSNGARLKLQVNKKVYHYHQGGRRSLFYCDTVSRREPLPAHHGDA